MKMLPHIAALGVDYIYVTACFAADNDPDETTWSQRQRTSGCGNPKNPYKIGDYFHVDEEYGQDEDGLLIQRLRRSSIGIRLTAMPMGFRGGMRINAVADCSIML